MEYWDLLGRYNAETQTFSAFAGTPNSPYRPKVNGTLKGIRVIIGGEAATSLTEGVRIRLSSVKWAGRPFEVAVNGNGLRTVPVAAPPVFDFACNLPVDTSSDITIEGACVEATHVTNSVYVLGKFEG